MTIPIHLTEISTFEWSENEKSVTKPPFLEASSRHVAIYNEKGIIRKVLFCILYKPLFSHTVIFAFLDFCGNSRVVNFVIFLMLSLL